MSDQLCAACGQHPAYLRCPGEHVDELATLRADLARVKAERDGFEDGLTIANSAAERRGRERDAACAQVRELQRVARAADVLSHALEDDAYERAGSFICRRCKMAAESPPDPSDARIAELEAALAGLVDALPRCDTCTKRGTTDWSGYGQAAIYCDEHLGFKSGSTLEWDSEAEAAERALGRRK